jgi:uncharacterized membrane protein
MARIRWSSILYNTCFGLNCLLLFLAVFGAKMEVPSLLQVAGRMHPLTLHFPIVLLLLAVVWVLAVKAKENPLYRSTGDALLLTAALSAAVAALMGLFLSKEGGYNEETILWHQWSGVAVSVIAWGWYAFRETIRNSKMGSRLLAMGSAAGIVLAGHQGATITHGENYLFAPVASEEQKPKVLLEDARVFEDLVRPILKEKCMNCHNTAKSKGDLIMETEALLLKGGKNGKLWDSTAVQFGLLMHRVHLPLGEKEHMPPNGKPQLTDQEMKILYLWIKSGANFTQKIAELSETDTLKMLSADLFKSVETDNYTFPAADENTVKKLNNDYRAVYPLAMKSPALGVEFFGISAFKPEYLKELSVVKEQVVSLNLNKMPVKDEDLKSIAILTNLRKLNLSFTQITGSTLGELKNLKLLRKLSLSGTGVKVADLAVLSALPDLSALYLWNTGVNDQDFTVLQKSLPHVRIEAGFKGDSVVAKLNAAVIEGDEQLFTTSTKVKLKNYVNGAVVRYTLDGSVPDSLTSFVSNGDSIVIDKPCLLTTKTFLPGWISSDVSTRSFYKVGFSPDSVVLAIPPNPQYRGEGPRTLANKKIGDTDFRSNKWLGFKDEYLESFMFFNQPVELSSVTLSTVIDIGSYIMPAQQVEVWGGTSKTNLVLLKKLNPEQPKGFGPLPYRTGFNCTFPTQKISILKIVAKPVSKLPDWHPGKGQPGWVFVDEVFLN